MQRMPDRTTRALILLAIPAAAFGIYLRVAGLPDVFCRAPDELAEMMPGIRLHVLPFLNVRDVVRYNFFQSMFYSQHGLGDVSFYYLASQALSWLGLPISERMLFLAGTVTNVALACAGAVLCARILGSPATGILFAILVFLSPYFVFVSRTGWGRLTWTPLLLMLLFLCQWQAMRRRGVMRCALWCGLAGFVSLTDGFMYLPILVVLGLFTAGGSMRDRVKRLAHDRAFLAACLAFSIGLTFDLLLGLEAKRRGTDLTMMGYVMLRGGHTALLPSLDVMIAWARAVDWYFPYRGAWLAVTAAFVLAAREGWRGRPVGFVAAWWLLASVSIVRYVTGMESLGRPAGTGWLNASGSLAVPSFLLVAWFVASIGQGTLPLVRRFRPAVRGALAIALWIALIAPMAAQADTVAFAETPTRGLAIDQLSGTAPPGLRACRTIKAAAFYVRSRPPALPYVFHLSSNVYLGHFGEFYYGLSYGRSSRPEDPNHLLDFGGQTGQFKRPHGPEEFARVYGVDHFDYYIDVADDRDPLKADALTRLFAAGARVVCTIQYEGQPIGRILSFSGDAPIVLDYRDAAAGWDRQFAHARTLLLQPLAGTAYHFGYNWRSPE